VATSKTSCHVSKSCGISKSLSSCACSCCCSTTPFSTLPSTQISRPSASSSAHPCGNLGPSNDRQRSACEFGSAGLILPLPTSLGSLFIVVLGSWPLACGESLLRAVLPESQLPYRSWLVFGAASHSRGAPLGRRHHETRHGDVYRWTRLSTQVRRRHLTPWEWNRSAH
jgi:hypothetical protein